MEVKDSYCPLPFDTVYSNNTGIYDLCCWADHDKSKKFFGDKANWKNVGPIEFFLSAGMNKIREKMLAGERIDLCETCYQQENKVGHSVRTKLIEERQPKKIEKINLRIRNFGNHCNLSCIMCIPYNSTTRQKELKQIGYTTDTWGTFPGVSYGDFDLFKKDLIKNAEHIGTISVTGGEPFAIPKFWKFFLEDMPQKYSQEISIEIETNLTNLKWNKYCFEDLVQRYKNVQLLVSCDHYGEKLGFIRHPIDVEQFENNLMHYHRYIMKLTLTVQLLNVFELKEIKNYYKKNFNLEMSTFSYVMETSKKDNPDWNVLSVRNLNQSAKNKITQMYKNFEDSDKNFFAELKLHAKNETKTRINDYLEMLSRNRKNNWKKLWHKEPVNWK